MQIRSCAVLLGFTLCSLLALFAGSPALASDDLATRAADKLRAALPGYTVTVVDERTLKLEHDGKTSGQLNLDRIAAFCAQNFGRCDEVLSLYVERSAQMTRDMDTPTTAAMLRAVVRPAYFLDEMKKELGGNADAAPVGQPYAGNLAAVCEFDFPTATRVVTTANLKTLGLTAEAAIAKCISNTQSSLPSLAGKMPLPYGHAIAQLSADAGYTSSRILFHDDWAKTARDLDWKLIVAVPADNLVFYTKEEGPEALAALGQLAKQEAQRAERPISTSVYRWTATGWDIAVP